MNDQNHAAPDVLIEVERLISHQLAHNLNNSLGAIGVFAEMLAEQLTDESQKRLLDKMALASEMARGQVTALRKSIPKHEQGQGVCRLSNVLDVVLLMLGDTAPRIKPSVNWDDRRLIGADISALTYILSAVISHVLGGSLGDVDLDAREDGEMCMITISCQGSMNPIETDANFMARVCRAYGARLDQMTDSAHGGFVLRWPASSVSSSVE